MSSTGGTGDLPGGVPGTVATATIAATTTSTSSTAATSGVTAATSDSHWFQHLLNMGPPPVAPAPGGSSMDTGMNPLLLQMITMQQNMQQQMIMMQQQWMAHGSSVNSAVSI